MSENKDDVLARLQRIHDDAERYPDAGLATAVHLAIALIGAQSSTIESLRRELDAVRRDGERYRWLRKQMPADAITIESTRPRPATRSLHLSEDEADSAIDAAISEARGRE